MMIEDKIVLFLGIWIFDVDESEFEQGDLLKSVILKIEDNFGMVIFIMNQVSGDGEIINDSFEVVFDGLEVKFGKSGLVDVMCFVFISL